MAILNEVGLDPGMDHMSAMKIIDDVHARGGEITSFSSVCGGMNTIIFSPSKQTFNLC